MKNAGIAFLFALTLLTQGCRSSRPDAQLKGPQADFKNFTYPEDDLSGNPARLKDE